MVQKVDLAGTRDPGGGGSNIENSTLAKPLTLCVASSKVNDSLK